MLINDCIRVLGAALSGASPSAAAVAVLSDVALAPAACCEVPFFSLPAGWKIHSAVGATGL
jgi:hypothetical protein